MIGALLAPLVGALLVWLLGKTPNLREAAALLAGAATFGCVLRVAQAVLAHQSVALQLFEPAPGLRFAFDVEPLGLVFALVASLLWPVTTLYSIGYMRAHHEQHQTRFYCFFAITISAVLALAFSANLVTLFVCYEAITLATFPLVTHANDRTAWHAGRIYLGVLMGTSIGLLLFGVVAVQSIAGTTEFTPGGVLSAPLALGNVSKATLGVILGLFVFGAGKAAVMPVHRWLPNAMVAPTPVSALLHAVAVVKAGVFTILKVVIYIFGIDLVRDLDAHTVLAYVAGFTVVAASVIALGKDNLKERLAYSTIGQLSYIVLGALVAMPQTIEGAGLHIATHAAGKITLFFGAGAILVAAHKKNVSELDGIGRRMPITMGCFFLGALSIIGLPPTGGTWSKLLLVEGTALANHWPLVGALLLSSLLNIAYLLSIPARAFLRPERPEHVHHEHGEAPWACRLAMLATAGLTLALFFFPDLIYRLVAMLVTNVS
ncbi:MAG: monovalent cation/H+ antiporter subunit D family protein [Planctomycetes bacterium]|nr:monovalent cation/H+ antiporter subunit D family protein [Planctomycetota bacterium]HPF13783.1 proton-conducting transporter membrane subunit [Planctomycetota bacterium]